jgi:hypothetical protein
MDASRYVTGSRESNTVIRPQRSNRDASPSFYFRAAAWRYMLMGAFSFTVRRESNHDYRCQIHLVDRRWRDAKPS